jgi:FkbM family methyltransferase
MALHRAGYWTRRRSVLPSGIDYLWDIQRLAARHRISIKRAFDVGAHVGQTALEFLDAFPNAEITSFEPNLNAFSRLADIKSDRFSAHQLAISDKCGTADLYVLSLPEAGGGIPSQNSSLVAKRQFGLVTGQYTETVPVQCQTIDRFCAERRIDGPDLLKIDTEGHEVEVLTGAQETLRSVSFIYVEFETMLPVKEATGGALMPVPEKLEPAGFRFMASYPVYMIDKPLYAAFNALYFRPRL